MQVQDTRDMMQRIDEDDFATAACARGLTEDSVHILLDQDINRQELVNSLTQKDIDDLKLSVDQTIIMLEWKQEMGAVRTTKPPQIRDDTTRQKTEQETRRSILNKANTFRDQLSLEFQDFGFQKIADLLKQKVAEYGKLDINIAVTGSEGVGKSSLVNAICGLKPGDLGAAEVSVHKSNTEMRCYVHPEKTNLMFWDVPTKNANELYRFDVVIICSAGRFRSYDLELAQTATELQIPFLCLRTKVDINVADTKRDFGEDCDENEAIEVIRKDVKDNLSGPILNCEHIYVVSSYREYSLQWDFPRLMQVVSNAKKNAEAVQAYWISNIEKDAHKLRNELIGSAERLAEEIASARNKSAQHPQYIQDTLETEANAYHQKFYGSDKPSYNPSGLHREQSPARPQRNCCWKFLAWLYALFTCILCKTDTKTPTSTVVLPQEDMTVLLGTYSIARDNVYQDAKYSHTCRPSVFGDSDEVKRDIKKIRKDIIVFYLSKYLNSLEQDVLDKLKGRI